MKKNDAYFPCPELDPRIAEDRKRAKWYIAELLSACSEYNLTGMRSSNLPEFIRDWQKAHGQMTFSAAVLLGVQKWDDQKYINMRMLEKYLSDIWNEYATKYNMKPTSSDEVKIAFELPDSARQKKPNNDLEPGSHKPTNSIFKSPIVIAAILIGIAILIAAHIMRPRQARYKVLGNDRILDSDTGKIKWGYPNKTK